MEQDNLNHHRIKDLSILKSSPGTFTKEFLQSYKYKNHSKELISDLDDEEENRQIKINKDKYQSDVLSTSATSTNQNQSSLTDDVNKKKIHSSSPPDYTPKIDKCKLNKN
jgi:hypothetical protein